MPAARLELASSHGDQTLGKIRFVVYRTANGNDTEGILREGLRFIEGRPTVSTNIVHAYDWTVNPEKHGLSRGGGTIPGSPGSVMVCAIPEQFYLGYGLFTTAYVDRALKHVSGAPLRYASARTQLAFYMSPEVETAREHIEAQVAGGYTLEQRPVFIVEPKFVVGTFSGPVFGRLAQRLDVSVRSLEPLDYNELERELRDLFAPMIPANAVLAPAVIRDLIIGTIESIVIARMRMMRWQGLGALGYTFSEGRQQVQVTPVRDVAEQRQRMDEIGRRLASSGLFVGETAWLKTFVANQLELMRVELDGAELEAAQ